MNTLGAGIIALLIFLAQLGSVARAQGVSSASAASAAAQAEAVRKYPPLGVPGSAFNRDFLARVQSARTDKAALFDDPAWPLTLADEVARALTPAATPGDASVPAPAAPPTDWYADQSAETFAALPAALAKLERQALDFELLSAAIFHATNAARRAHDLRPLIYLPALREAAWDHSRDMGLLDFFSHENPQVPERATPARRLEAHGLTRSASAENISSLPAGDHTYWSYARAVVAQWMNSPGHRANILGAKYTHLGCAAHPCQCPTFHLLATENFVSAASGFPDTPPTITKPPPTGG